MSEAFQSLLTQLAAGVTWTRSQVAAIDAVSNSVVALAQRLRTVRGVLLVLQPPAAPARAYETLWLDLVFDIQDGRGERAVLTRTQRIKVLAPDGAVVRELVWGQGDQLVRYTAHGARRLRVRPEGSKHAVLLDPDRHLAPGDKLTITSHRTIRGGFREREEYCEAFLERPTGRLDITVRFPRSRPPKQARLVAAATEQVLRAVPVRYGADGRAVLRCRVRTPAIASTYSLRWAW